MSMKNLPKTGKNYDVLRDLNNGAYDDSHHLLELKQVPESLTALRSLLAEPQNADIRDYAISGKDFEECIGRVAMYLGIVLDGDYDVGPLCSVLVAAVERRRMPGFSTTPSAGDSRLVPAEIVETATSLSLEVGQEAGEPLVPEAPKKLITPQEMN